ncbi:hypothetical protein [Bacillus phage vB_BceS-M2]
MGSAISSVTPMEQKGYLIMGIKYFEYALGKETKFDVHGSSTRSLTAQLKKLEAEYAETFWGGKEA